MTKNIKISVQLLRTLYINRILHMIFNYLFKIVELIEQNSNLQQSLNLNVCALNYQNVKIWSHTNWWIQNSIIQNINASKEFSTKFFLKKLSNLLVKNDNKSEKEMRKSKKMIIARRIARRKLFLIRINVFWLVYKQHRWRRRTVRKFKYSRRHSIILMMIDIDQKIEWALEFFNDCLSSSLNA